MKKHLLFLILSFILTTSVAQDLTYKQAWKKVENFELKDLPKSALAEVEKIYTMAKGNENDEQLIRSFIYKSKFALEIQENAQLSVISNLKKEINDSKFPTRNILESVLADLYWQYFQQNRYKFYNRTKTDQKVDTLDFRTWDLQTLFKETHLHYRNSLLHKDLLQKISIKDYSEILIHKENSDIYRPTLYDFIAHRALDFYRSNERNIQNPTYKFTIENQNLLKKNSIFLQTNLVSKDSLSQQLNAIYLYKDLIQFHFKDKDPSALIDLTVERLNFIKNNAAFENKKTTYLNSLLDLKEQYKTHPASTEISFQIAYLYNNQANQYNPKQNPRNQFKRLDALKVCKNANQRFPESKGSEKCKLLIKEIQKENLRITVEKFIPINTPSRILIHYKNISDLEFKIFKTSTKQMNQFMSLRTDSVRVGFINDLVVEKQWISKLKTENDFQKHSTEVLFPTLSSGRYLIVTNKKDHFKTDDLYAYSFVQVTDISLIRIDDSKMEVYQVINRNTGKPIKKAKIHAKNKTNYANREKQINRIFYSDKDGFIQFEKNNYYNVLFDIKYKNDKAIFGDYYIYNHHYKEDQEKEITAKTFLFTDRSIYRPGQPIYFKGILIQTINNKSKIVADEVVTITLYDVNNEDVKELELTTNEFGTFSGEFILPSSGLTGDFLIEVDEGSTDSKFYDKIDNFEMSETYISVEEYKRPKFETKFKPTKESYRLNDSITVTGEAISFSGSKISGAKVKYRVVRTENFPTIYRYYNPYPTPSAFHEISHGETTTDLSGNYAIKFKAVPNQKINKDQKPVFNYKIYADVTDINGETHSTETTVRVAYHMLEIQLSIARSMDKNSQNNTITINSKNLNGEFIPVTGQLTIYKLRSPEKILRKSLWQFPDYSGFTEENFKKLFPHDAYQNENNKKRKEKGAIVFKQEINTRIQKEITLANIKNWKIGKYLAVFTCADKFDQPIEKENQFGVNDYSGKEIGKEQLIVVTTNKNDYKPGEQAEIKFLSAANNLFVTVFIEKDHKIIERKTLHINSESKTIKIPVNKEDIGGFALHYHTAFYNSFKNATINIRVSYPEKELQITTQTFRDKIQPGSKQEWSFSIAGDQKDKVSAEILASMYDASLDQFKPHFWNFDPITYPTYYSYNISSANRSFGINQLSVKNLPYSYFRFTKQQYDQLNWFGFSFNNNRWTKQRYLNALIDKYTKPTINSSNDQSKEKGFIYGIVYDESDKLPGVNVIVKGTSSGVTTDFDGKFKIKAKKNDQIIFSYIGMKTIELKVKKDNYYSIKMVENENSLDEVVVTALGIKKSKGDIIEIEEQDEAEVVDVSFAMAGKVAGVEVSPAPGASKKLIIRGNSSIKNNNALIIIDGVPFIGNKDLELTDDEIIDVKILKGEEAIALYGSKGKNGVMLITTKAGQAKLNKELNRVKARTNFKETAFFYPNLTTDKDGNFTFNFTIPEALTKWKLQLLAHTKDLRTGYKQLSTITQKDLMVIPNMPRFLRENDTLVISTKISNLSKENLNGIAQLKLFDAITGKDISSQLLFANETQNKNFSVDSKNSTSIQWKIFIPKNIQAIQYRIVAKAGDFSDGEQNILPVLSNRMLVTETMTMQVKGNEKKTFTLEKLKNNTSKTLTNHKLTLEITSNPIWYAIQAMPYLMEFPYECSEQIFSRYYSNTLASFLMNSNPKIESVFKQWSSADVLISNLEKNPELKSIILQETPWLRDAQSETEQKKRLALLFDLNKIKNEQKKTLDKLKQMQRSDGGFPWFSGGRYANRNITQHIAIGFGKLNTIIEKDNKLSPQNYANLLKKAISFLDNEILEDYKNLLIRAKEIDKKNRKEKKYNFLKQNHTGNSQIQYLYMRSFFKDIPLDKKYKEAVDYYKKQSFTYWTDYELYSRGLITLFAKRDKNLKIANEIYQSLEEKSITNKEMGMYWKNNQPSWHWFQSPIQTHSLLMEVFNEMGANDTTVDNLKLWLLKNKQTNSWKTTKATTNAIYAILSTGSNWLEENELVKVKVGEKTIHPLQLENTKIEAGTGYFKTSWNTTEIKPEMAEVTLEKESKGVAFGGLYWQYFEDLDKITPAKTGIKISKKLFLKKNTNEGIKLYQINKNTQLKLGDLVTVRIEIKSDREMEFVHLKDMRASAFEPVNTLSEYKYQDNLYYYESTKDASTNFFIDRLPKGVFIFEYELRVNNQGNFSNGITTMQSMYAPEFSSHSKGMRIKIK
ncbi:MAG: carboxypeptidase-like regulatory domain-containing protein [Flavobacteriaceae bacterium]|nr:carboxypeptidase-like regulatory domain-containing protein [Flavobacteriaceae bacterium]